MQQNRNVYRIAFCAVCVALNIVLGILMTSLSSPIYFDTLGTVLSAVAFGPLWGAAVGGLSNVITGLMNSVTDIPFALVSIVAGLIVGFTARKFGWNGKVALATGVVLGIVCPIVGTPIGIFVYGGLNGTVSDVLVMGLVQTGQSIFAASFLRNLASNLADKVLTSLISAGLLKALPDGFKDSFDEIPEK